MGRAQEQTNRAMLRVRDRIDREYATELDLGALAAGAHYSPDHLIRTFRRVFGETPHRYLQRRRVERAMLLLRTTDLPVTDVCLQVGFTSVGAFGALFAGVVGESPSAYRARGPLPSVPAHFVRAWTRPSEHTECRSGEERPERGDARLGEHERVETVDFEEARGRAERLASGA